MFGRLDFSLIEFMKSLFKFLFLVYIIKYLNALGKRIAHSFSLKYFINMYFKNQIFFINP